jgi:phosphoribosylformylglycinamidine synthase
MRTTWRAEGETREVVAPLSLIVTAFAPCEDARRTLTPQLRTDRGATELVLVDLGRGRNRLGASILAQVYGQVGDRTPDLDDPEALKRFLAAIQSLARDGLLLAYHDRSDGVRRPVRRDPQPRSAVLRPPRARRRRQRAAP